MLHHKTIIDGPSTSQSEKKAYWFTNITLILSFEHYNIMILGEGKLNRGREFENVFKFLWGNLNQGKFEIVTPGIE